MSFLYITAGYSDFIHIRSIPHEPFSLVNVCSGFAGFLYCQLYTFKALDCPVPKHIHPYTTFCRFRSTDSILFIADQQSLFGRAFREMSSVTEFKIHLKIHISSECPFHSIVTSWLI